LASACLALAWYRKKFGIAIAAKTPMIATTINNSINVKPRGLLSVRFGNLNSLTLAGRIPGSTYQSADSQPSKSPATTRPSHVHQRLEKKQNSCGELSH
jgi:hypothetical protein